MRKAKRVIIFNDNLESEDNCITNTDDSDQSAEVALIWYSHLLDFCQDIIKGSMHAQRHKTVICKMLEANACPHLIFFFLQTRKICFFFLLIFPK